MNLVKVFQEMKRIHGFCPCCGDLFRLSDVNLFTREPPPKTAFDKLEDRQRRLEVAIAKFEDRESSVRALAVTRGQAEARKRLRRIAPFFLRRRIDPQDVKVIFSPVSYVAFKGMARDRISAIELIDRPATNRQQEKVHRSLESALAAGNVEWQMWRIDQHGRVVMGR